jgi:peptidoglycan DL-endopeptidase CwlO
MRAIGERAGSSGGPTAAMDARRSQARALAAALLAITAGCATAKTSQPRASSAEGRGPTAAGSSTDERWRARTDRQPSGSGEAPSLPAALAAARGSVGVESPEIGGKPAPRDCALFIGAVFAAGGVDLFADARDTDGGVRAIYRYVQRRGRLRPRGPPAAGDLVFFDNSYDRNGDGRANDRLTHMGLVDEVRPDGTVFVIHSTNHGIVREPMNLSRPHELTNGRGERINAFLRRKRPREPARLAHRHLMSELFAGFGSVLAVETARADCTSRASRRSCAAGTRRGRAPRSARPLSRRSD